MALLPFDPLVCRWAQRGRLSGCQRDDPPPLVMLEACHIRAPIPFSLSFGHLSLPTSTTNYSLLLSFSTTAILILLVRFLLLLHLLSFSLLQLAFWHFLPSCFLPPQPSLIYNDSKLVTYDLENNMA
jgi:hypothetical protein